MLCRRLSAASGVVDVPPPVEGVVLPPVLTPPNAVLNAEAGDAIGATGFFGR